MLQQDNAFITANENPFFLQLFHKSSLNKVFLQFDKLMIQLYLNLIVFILSKVLHFERSVNFY